MRIAPETLAILEAHCVPAGECIRLTGQLDRPTYLAVDRVLESLGGKWDKKTKAHQFGRDITDAFEQVLEIGTVIDLRKELRQGLNYFPTPAAIAEKVCDAAELQGNMAVLEPSAGKGALVRTMLDRGLHLTVAAVEIHPPFCGDLQSFRFTGVIIADFLSLEPSPLYDRVVMNPPFRNQQDVDHVRRAFDWLKPSGILVAIMSPSWQWRQNRKSECFREWFEEMEGSVEPLPDGAFKESGTEIPTVMVKMRRTS